VLMAAKSDNVTFWDKQTGIIVESSEHGDGYTIDAVVTETNMWGSTTMFLGLSWWLWAIFTFAIVASVAFVVVLLLLRRRKSKSMAHNSLRAVCFMVRNP
jgi:hypothetical protein